MERFEDRVNPTPVVSVASLGDVTEGGAASAFRFTGSGFDSPAEVYFSFSISSTAMSGIDFTAGSLWVTVGNGVTDLSITPANDSNVERTESIILVISSSMNYTIDTGSATMYLYDDPPVISVSRLADGTEGGSDGTFRVSRTGGDITQSIVVTYTVGGTATGDDDEDYLELSGSVTIAANNAYADITIDVTNDSDSESTETVILTLDSDPDWVNGAASATLFIWDNEGTFIAWEGDENANWMDPDNWAGGVVPGASDFVVFSGSTTYGAVLSGPLSPYTIAGLILESSFTGTITLSFPLTVGSLQMSGGTIDQPDSAYGSDLTITGAATWSGGELNSTANPASVIFDGATVVIDGTGLETGSDIEFASTAMAVGKGDLTFSNGTIAIVGTSAAFTINGFSMTYSGSVGGGVKVDGGSASFIGSSSIEWLHVLNGGVASTTGNAVVTVTGNVPGYADIAVRVYGGDLNIQNGTTLSAGSNWVTVEGATGGGAYGNLNTFASINPAGGLEIATIKTAKLVVGHEETGSTFVTIGNGALRPDLMGVHRYGQLKVDGDVKWAKGSFTPTIDDTVGIRDQWYTTGTFNIRGASTYVNPGGTTTADREEIVIKADNNITGIDATKPDVATPWAWKTGTAYNTTFWKVKRGS